ncbi:MAG: glycosyltransferase family 2 protein [Pseudomonadota bacterium]
MPFKSGAAFLRRAIGSVLAQDLTDLELLLANDGADPACSAVAFQAAEKDPRVRLVNVTGAGPAAARNAALAGAQGDWISVVDADDLIHPFRLRRLIAQATSLDVDGIADNLILFGSEQGKTLMDPLGVDAAVRLTAPYLLASEGGSAPLGYLKPIIRREALGGLSYREDLQIGEDFDFLLRLALSGARLTAVPEAYYLYRRHPKSTSHRLSARCAEAMIAAQDALADHNPDDTPLQTALALRRSLLTREMRFAQLVEALKARDIAAALASLASSPRLFLPLSRVIAAKLSPRQAKASSPLDLTLEGRDKVSLAGASAKTVHGSGRSGLEALGYVTSWQAAELTAPADGWTTRETRVIETLPGPVGSTDQPIHPGRVQVRTPTFKRPATLRRCLESLIAQTHQDWVCDVFDDDPDGAGSEIVDQLGDPRIRYWQNTVQNFASRNIDQCFSRANPNRAEWFCVVEDDNFLLPRFMEDNIACAQETGVEIVFRNQLIEWDAETPQATLSEVGILDRKFRQRIYSPEHFRLSLLADIGVSNGGLFWSHRAVSDLEVHVPCSATLQEYYRTFAVSEPVFVAMEPLAVWAENGSQTTRDLGVGSARFWREVSLKASVGRLQRMAWRQAPAKLRAGFLSDEAFAYPKEKRARGLVKSLLQPGAGHSLRWRERGRLMFRGAAIRAIGRPEAGVAQFLRSRGVV